jgi:hypothetical protein
MVRKVGLVRALCLQQRLADAGHVAMPEDPEAAGDGALLDTVAFGPLVGQKPHDGLGDGQPHENFLSTEDVSGSRGSSFWAAHVSRTHWCAGSSRISHSRSPGPAMTLR